MSHLLDASGQEETLTIQERRHFVAATFRPLQHEAMDAVLAGRDSIVVLPSGGGMSLCFQAPALVRDGLAVVVSPLISLMKDQVDTLTGNGVPAVLYNSSLAPEEKSAVIAGLRQRRIAGDPLASCGCRSVGLTRRIGAWPKASLGF